MADKFIYESEVLENIHSKAVTAKNECFFVGFLDGILANKRLDETELEPLLAECAAICRIVADDDAAEIIVESTAGHEHTTDELFALLQQIAEVRTQKIDPDCRRSSANRVLGFCAGVNCDSIITTAEAIALYEKLKQPHDLEDDRRIVALRHRLRDALDDGIIDKDEAEDISRLITTVVGDSYADTGIASSEAIPVICDNDPIDESMFKGQLVVLTGGFAYGTRREVSTRVGEMGGTVQENPTKDTSVVVIGSEGSRYYTYSGQGGKLAKAIALREKGSLPKIYTEGQIAAFLR